MVIQELDNFLSLTDDDLGDFTDSIKEKFDEEEILTEHYRKGRCDKPYLGFNECGLPVVLSHNCPNNSLPILWHSSSLKKIRALFPRTPRYKVST